MTGPEHWDRIYSGRDTEALSWFEAEPGLSLELIRAHGEPGPAVDIGAGASRLVDGLLAAGYEPVTALDLSAEGLRLSQARLGDTAERVEWVVADVTAWQPRHSYALWHDRAVFHFLTERQGRAAYLAALDAALRPGGTVVIGTFAEDGPESCSGLPVQRYSPQGLAAEVERHLPGRFMPVFHERHLHISPAGAEQRFQFSVLKKLSR